MKRLLATLLVIASAAFSQVATWRPPADQRPPVSTVVTTRPLAPAGSGPAPSTLLTDLTSAWLLQDTSDSHGSNTLTNNNGVTFVAPSGTPPANMPPTVASFVAASSQYFDVADNSSFNVSTTGFTLSFWIYATAGFQYMSKDDAGANRSWAFTGTSFFIFDTDSTFVSVTLTGLGAGNDWRLVQLWYDPVTKKPYGAVNNGTVDEGATALAGLLQDQPVSFKINRFSTSFATGQGSQVLFHRRVLTAPERGCLWNGGAGGFYPFTGLCN